MFPQFDALLVSNLWEQLEQTVIIFGGSVTAHQIFACTWKIWASNVEILPLGYLQSFTAPLDTISPLYTLAHHFNMNFWSFRLLDIMLTTSVSTLICWSTQNRAPLFQKIYPNMGGITWCTQTTPLYGTNHGITQQVLNALPQDFVHNI